MSYDSSQASRQPYLGSAVRDLLLDAALELPLLAPDDRAGVDGVHAPDGREVGAGLDAGRGAGPRGRVEGAALQAQSLDRRVAVARNLDLIKH